MTQDVHVILNPGLARQCSIQQKEEGPFYQQIGLKFKEEISKVLHLEYSLNSAETWILWKVGQKYLENFEMWCWRRMEKDGSIV